MEKKNLWLGMLVMVLAFGMSVVGCDNPTNSKGTPRIVTITYEIYGSGNYSSFFYVLSYGNAYGDRVRLAGVILPFTRTFNVTIQPSCYFAAGLSFSVTTHLPVGARITGRLLVDGEEVGRSEIMGGTFTLGVGFAYMVVN